MDKRSEQLINYIKEAINHSQVSGFEVLELLDVRSLLASRELLLDETERSVLEDLDRKLLHFADSWLERISEVADLAEMRRKAHALPSHWWWYLDEITSAKHKVAENQ